MDTETDPVLTPAPDPESAAANAAPRKRRPRRRLVAAIAAVVAAALILLATPLPRGFQGEATGDPRLVSEIENALGSKHWHHVAAAKIDGDEVTWAGVGADENSEFEIGSITKTFTAALFADAVDRGEVDEDTRLGEVWPHLSGKVAEVTLSSIAMQRSGLPPQEPAASFGDGLATFAANYLHTDPYRASADDIVKALDDVDVGEKTPEYSNFAFAVLGQALATAADSDYGELVRDRITDPLGMTSTYVPKSADGLSYGYTASGLPAAPWTMGGSASAGAIRSTAHDLSIWLRATMEGTAPGAEAAEPREDYDESDRIGWAWVTTTDRSPNLTWHNGGTGGYRSFLGFDPASQQGIIVLADSANWVDSAAGLISKKGSQAAPRTANMPAEGQRS